MHVCSNAIVDTAITIAFVTITIVCPAITIDCATIYFYLFNF